MKHALLRLPDPRGTFPAFRRMGIVVVLFLRTPALSGQDLALRIDLSTTQVEANEPLFALLRLENRSDRPLPLPSFDLAGDWLSFEGRDATGHLLGQDWMKNIIAQIGPFADTLRPSEQWYASFLVQAHFFTDDGDFSTTGVSRLAPGVYQLKAHFNPWFPGAEPNGVSPAVVSSPTVSFTVLPSSSQTLRRYERFHQAARPLFSRTSPSPVDHILDEIRSISEDDPENPWLLYLTEYAVPFALAARRTLTIAQDRELSATRLRLVSRHGSLPGRVYLLQDLSAHRSPQDMVAAVREQAIIPANVLKYFAARPRNRSPRQ